MDYEDYFSAELRINCLLPVWFVVQGHRLIALNGTKPQMNQFETRCHWSVEGLLYRYVPECLSLRRNWAPPPPPSQASVSPPLNPKRGEQHSLECEVVGEPIPTKGQKAWHSVYSVLCRKYVHCTMYIVLQYIYIAIFSACLWTWTPRGHFLI